MDFLDSNDEKKDIQTAGCNSFFKPISDGTINKFKANTKEFNFEDIKR
jgi:hypothetical protein